MTNNLSVTTERVDDIPVLVAQAKKIGVADLLDQHFVLHGNWQGTSLGWTSVLWLTHILSEGDHRLNQVEDWVEKRQHTLKISSGQDIRAQEWSDDRLGIVLDELADDVKWRSFETGLNQHTFRVYNLKPKRVRVDSTTASGYWTVTEDGLFQFGHSKDHRPDLPQLKVMISALDPMGMPTATQVVAGKRGDDQLYIPAIQQVRESVAEDGLLYVGDSKMGALVIRAFIENNHDYYLCPLAKKQMPEETLESYLELVWSGKEATEPVFRENEEGQAEKIAEGFEQKVSLSVEVNGKTITWTERHLIVLSYQYARASEEALHTRLEKAQAELIELNERKQGKKAIEDSASMQAAAEDILKRYRVAGLVKLNIEEHCQERHVRAYRDNPARIEIERTVNLQIEINQQAVQEAVRRFGWRVYATNHVQDVLPLGKAILAYREEFLVERGFGRLKGKPLSLTPMYLQSDARATGLVRLLSIGLRMLTLIEHQARQQLAELKQKISGLYTGNPTRATSRPTAEALLHAFKGIDLSIVKIGEQILYHVSPLSEVQQKILALLDFSVDIYSQLVSAFPKPPGKLTEP